MAFEAEEPDLNMNQNDRNGLGQEDDPFGGCEVTTAIAGAL